ncbi:TPA: endonuclease [Patescibacteria group bacterium]|uniref:LAGLIDADG homing endonuclease n=1 Tax=candidate division Kazan bacterium GW2011_GWB1_52_7 TaxID=1620414 RepID=A0A0G1X5Z9_UNCK3|nr:MAG: LAGLIDADG homing endonuclease [candidate division Kazan bacterium GW2011_GWC1_52_13]KKW26573.1 MAG: LAGLIDADG homing endonuclease [candidate division Kazan bacterium GW2011_GWB1_52_7]HCR42620.1 endonuclease [Patescibacteria group bacterium]
MSADNQQERLSWYVAGYVDGEGSFHVAIQKSPNVKLGYQVIPEFHVSQNQERASMLREIQQLLGCGYIKDNHRTSLTDKSQVLVVRDRHDLLTKVIPFFRHYPLLSSKQTDFQKFAEIVSAMRTNHHLEKNGLKKIIIKAFSMNGGGRYRKLDKDKILANLESSETICQVLPHGRKDIVRTA